MALKVRPLLGTSTRGHTTKPGATCWICLDDDGELYDACACRGSAGAIHVGCYYKFCKSSDRGARDVITCSTCKQKFHGELQMKLATMAWQDAMPLPTCEPARRAAHRVFNLSLHDCGNFDAAVIQEHEYQEAYKAVYGPESRGLLSSRLCLGNALRGSGNPAAAVECHRITLERALRVYGEDDELAMFGRNNLANALEAVGDYTESDAIRAQVIAVKMRVNGPGHPSLLLSQGALCNSLLRQDRWQDAQELLSKFIPVATKTLGPDHPQTLRLLACKQECESKALSEGLSVAGNDPAVNDAMAHAVVKQRDAWKRAVSLDGAGSESTMQLSGATLVGSLRALGEHAEADWMAEQMMRARCELDSPGKDLSIMNWYCDLFGNRALLCKDGMDHHKHVENMNQRVVPPYGEPYPEDPALLAATSYAMTHSAFYMQFVPEMRAKQSNSNHKKMCEDLQSSFESPAGQDSKHPYHRLALLVSSADSQATKLRLAPDVAEVNVNIFKGKLADEIVAAITKAECTTPPESATMWFDGADAHTIRCEGAAFMHDSKYRIWDRLVSSVMVTAHMPPGAAIKLLPPWPKRTLDTPELLDWLPGLPRTVHPVDNNIETLMLVADEDDGFVYGWAGYQGAVLAYDDAAELLAVTVYTAIVGTGNLAAVDGNTAFFDDYVEHCSSREQFVEWKQAKDEKLDELDDWTNRSDMQ